MDLPFAFYTLASVAGDAPTAKHDDEGFVPIIINTRGELQQRAA